jgi:hypothetical protein
VQYEGVVPVLCKNVGTLEIYTKTRRSHKPGGTVSRAGKDRRKTTKVALESDGLEIRLITFLQILKI